MSGKEENPIEKVSDCIDQAIEDAAEAVTGTAHVQHVTINNYGAASLDGAKSVGVAYAFWFFLGWFGGHKFYLRKTAVGVAYLVLGLLTLIISLISLALLGWITGIPLTVLLIIDVFTIPNQVRQFNAENLN